MIDYTNIPSISSHQTFFALGSTTWQTWQKPRNCKYVYITAIGGGGGGGSSPNISGNAGGGGGGGSSSITNILLPASCIPDTLYILVGLGGAGGTGGGAGGTGGVSFVAISPSTTAINVFIRSGNPGALGGDGGTGSAGGLGGNGGTAINQSVALLSSLGVWTSRDGDPGANGGFTVAGLNKTALSSFPLCGGAGGAGKTSTLNRAGGSILAGGVLGRVGGGSGGGGAASVGSKGLITITPNQLVYSFTEFPFATSGGGGGGSNVTVSGGGGNGGAGEIGSGGGGSGAIDGGTGRVGGRGGDGIVFITAF